MGYGAKPHVLHPRKKEAVLFQTEKKRQNWIQEKRECGRNMKKRVRVWMLLSLLTLFTASVCTGCSAMKKSAVETFVGGERVCVALGDSICSGYRLNEPEKERYSALLSGRLGYSEYNYGVDGQTGGELLEFLQDGKAEALERASLVIVSIGGNNVLAAAMPAIRTIFSVGSGRVALEKVYEPINAGIASFGEELCAILAEIRKAAPNARIVVQTVYNPYRSFTWFKLRLGGERLSLADFVDSCMRRLNEQILALSKQQDFLVCDVYTVFEQAYDRGERPVNASGIGLIFDPHPNASGHLLIAQAYEELLQPYAQAPAS